MIINSRVEEIVFKWLPLYCGRITCTIQRKHWSFENFWRSNIYLQIEGRKKMWLSGRSSQAQASAYAIHHLETTVKIQSQEKNSDQLINLDANESWCLTTGIRCSINQRELITTNHSESPRMALSRNLPICRYNIVQEGSIDAYNPQLPVPLHPTANEARRGRKKD